ncbi:Translin-1 [Zalaria obscura]|uniref:Translin-1 n=1 Tax=Zalaria obscura TaxID=2024903 RepID=A0ACC3SJ48_9PEZI
MDGMVQPQIFESLQAKIDEDSSVREALRDIVQTLEKQDRATQAILSRVHSTPTDQLPSVTSSVEESIQNEINTIAKLSESASKYPYYKQQATKANAALQCFSILYCGYLGGYASTGNAKSGRLLTIEEVGQIMNVPVNLKDRDAFHLTIEEYLLALITLIDELARLARNSVTQGDYSKPVQISKFIKDIHAGFQILNLKNDALRKRSDGIKYRVKEVEDVVYDLSLRGLTPKA